MAYKMDWIVPQQLIYLEVGTDATDDFEQFDIDMNQMLSSADQAPNAPLVHILCELKATAKLPPLSVQRKFTFPKQPKFGWSLYVGVQNPAVQVIVSIVPQLFRQRVRLFKTAEEAINFIQEVDASLPDLAPYLKAMELNIDYTHIVGKR